VQFDNGFNKRILLFQQQRLLRSIKRRTIHDIERVFSGASGSHDKFIIGEVLSGGNGNNILLMQSTRDNWNEHLRVRNERFGDVPNDVR
jgi:hypothetical protein